MIKLLRSLMVASTLLASFGAHASDRDWKPHQLAMGAAAVAMHLADWGQTRHIAVSNGRFHEDAPVTQAVIGRQPGTGEVDLYMAATGALFLAAAHFLPDYRTAILAGFTVSKIGLVVNNHTIGLRIGGSF